MSKKANYFSESIGNNLPKEYATQEFDQHDMQNQNQQVNDGVANSLYRSRTAAIKTPIIFVSGNLFPIAKQSEVHTDSNTEENSIKDENANTDSGIWNKNELAAKLMIRMGYEEGKGLGKDLQGISQPLMARPRIGRGAIGAYGPENSPVPAKIPKSKKHQDLREMLQKKRKRTPYSNVEEFVNQNGTKTSLADNSHCEKHILNGDEENANKTLVTTNYKYKINNAPLLANLSDDDVVILDSSDMFESLGSTQTANSVSSKNIVPPLIKLTKKQRRRERQRAKAARRETNKRKRNAGNASVEAMGTIMSSESSEHISFCSCNSSDDDVGKALMVEICKHNRDRMTKLQVEYITEFVCQALVKSKEAPKFEGTLIKNDAIQIQCANSASLQWLSDVIALAPDFDGCKFIVKVNSKLQRLIRLKIWIPGKQRSARFIYDVLCAQNEGLDAKSWRTYFYGPVVDRPHEFLLVFGIDLISFKLLRTKFDMKLYFHFWHLPVTIRGRVGGGTK